MARILHTIYDIADHYHCIGRTKDTVIVSINKGIDFIFRDVFPNAKRKEYRRERIISVMLENIMEQQQSIKQDTQLPLF